MRIGWSDIKINFIIPSIGMSGGVKVVLEYANHLQAMGHEAKVIYPLIQPGLKRVWYKPRALANILLDILFNLKRGVRIDWYDLKADLVRVITLSECDIPDADITVATWWATAWSINKYKKNKGQKFYLIQHYEIWGGPKAAVEGTYKLGFRNIVISSWLKDILVNKLNAPVEALLLDAIDTDIFYPEVMKQTDATLRILMPYRPEKWKGVADGVKAFEITRATYPDIKLVMFGPGQAKDIPEYVEYHKGQYGESLRKIYNSCDIFMFPSRVEGFGLPPMEAMACRRAVITTNVGAVPDYSIAGETALVSPPMAPELLAENMMKLIEDTQLREKIANAGYEFIQQFSWDKMSKALEGVFIKSLNTENQVDNC